MHRAALLFAVILAGHRVATYAFAGPADAKSGAVFIEAKPDQLAWGPAPAGLPAGAQAVVLEGDPAKTGYFALRLKAPAGYKIMPHTHPGVERVTVLEGTLYLGMGGTWDEAALKPYPAGSYFSIPKGHKHFGYFKDGGILQLASLGPWGIQYIHPSDDPRRKQATP
ncbi:MAG TPA: cupin domain-containing protein [Elusimicrobiota bacterium]|jgi:quercetin dioxygenase-like cupin family protein|nr:cupin domain-containing protein [Elusimicrobiota bacterium]